MYRIIHGWSQGGREGALTPPSPGPCPKFSFFMCVVVKCGDLIETVINSA